MELTARKPKPITLTKTNLKFIETFATSFSYSTNSNLFYENQVPMVAYALLEGEILLTKTRRKSLHIPERSIVGIQEIIHNIPSLYAAEITKGSKVLFLDKSCIQELAESSNKIDGKLGEFLRELAFA